MDLALAENKLQSRSVFDRKCPAHPCAVTQKTLCTVDFMHLEAVNEWRASSEIGLVDADVHLPVDKHLQDKHVRVRQSIQNRGRAHVRSSLAQTPEPLHMILKRVGLPQTKAPEWRNGLPWITKSRRKQENASTWILRSFFQFDFPGEVPSPPAQQPHEQALLSRTIQ
jgi:hypothetical protein